jgi:hypothetical protein
VTNISHNPACTCTSLRLRQHASIKVVCRVTATPDGQKVYNSTSRRRFRETGSIDEKRRSGRPSVLSNDSLEDIRARLLQSQRKSLRKLSQQTGMTYGSVHRATKRLKLHPYRVHSPHGLRDFCITLYYPNNINTCRVIDHAARRWLFTVESRVQSRETSSEIHSSTAHCQPSFCHCSIPIYHLPTRYAIALTKHHIIIYLVLS